MNLKRVWIAHGETTFVITKDANFLGVYDNHACYELDSGPRVMAPNTTVRKFRLDDKHERPGLFTAMSSSGHPISVQNFHWRILMDRPHLVTMNERERTRFCGNVTVESVGGAVPHLALSEDWHETSVCFDSERNSYKYCGWNKFPIAEGYFAYVDR